MAASSLITLYACARGEVINSVDVVDTKNAKSGDLGTRASCKYNESKLASVHLLELSDTAYKCHK